MKHSRRRSTLQNNSNDSNDFGDDFDDFEEGGQAGADDDFGDFDDEFQEPEVEAEDATASPVSTSQPNQIPAQPFVSFVLSTLRSQPS